MAAQDRYEEYFTEKLWSMIPDVYRAEDGVGPQPGVLRNIVTLIAEQAAISRRSIDRLWEDQHIETCDDWAVPYIGDLVGTRMLPESDSHVRRADVARTVHFRRRRGTPSLIAELVDDLSGWDVVLVEAFRRLARTPHRLDAFPVEVGRTTRTPVAGTADLRSARSSDLTGTPFDEFFRTPDVRLLRGRVGRFGLGNVNLHLFRLFPQVIDGATPGVLDDAAAETLPTYTFDPSGRDVALFTRGVELESTSRRCTASQEWEIARQISCRLLSDAAYQISSADVGALPDTGTGAPTAEQRAAIEALVGFRFATEARLRRRLQDLGVSFSVTPTWYQHLLELSVTRDSARPQLFPDSVAVFTELSTFPIDSAELIVGADLSSRECQPDPANPLIQVLIDPKLGRFAFPTPPASPPLAPTVRYLYGSSGDVGAGSYERTPVVPRSETVPLTPPESTTLDFDENRLVEDSRTYTIDAAAPIVIDTTDGRVLESLGRQRPYIEFTGAPAGQVATFEAGVAGAKLTFDGVWLGSDKRNSAAHVLDLIIGGAAGWDEIRINCSTLDPGGKRADLQHLGTLRISVRTSVRLLRISRSIVGPIVVDDAGGAVDTIEIVDSIVDATRTGTSTPGAAIVNHNGHARLAGVTVLGSIEVERMLASDTIVMGDVKVADTQHSCLRYSAAPLGPRMPDQYRFRPTNVEPFYFTSLRFGDPGYCELSTLAPEALHSGAENGSEMGAFSFGSRTSRMASLSAKVDEFKPVAILTQFIIEGEKATGALP